MDEPIVLSKHKLATFLACERRFQLRFLDKVPWPAEPPDDAWQLAAARGEAFHQLLERYFLGLPVVEQGIADPVVRRWWADFRGSELRLPAGRYLPEVTLTVPLGGHLLTGRFDLLILGDGRADIYDWKTAARPQDATMLKTDWQTRVYLALLVEGSRALGRLYRANEVRLTYWFIEAPESPVTIGCDPDQHAHTWRLLADLVERISRQLAAGGPWRLTDNWPTCGDCDYKQLCGRKDAPAGVGRDPEDEPAGRAPLLEPLFP